LPSVTRRASGGERSVDDIPGGCRLTGDHAVPVTRELGDVRILAVQAMEITARCRDGERQASGKEVEKRFFFDRVDVPGNHLVIYKGVQDAVLILAYTANAPFARNNDAVMAAQAALDFLCFSWFLKHRLFH
jgi:hypothetical protein